MSIAVVLAATLQAAAPSVQSVDVSWMAGYWLDCSDGREASETWSDPREGLSVGHAVTVSDGRAAFEVSHITLTPQGFAYVAQPGGTPPTVFPIIDGGPSRVVFSNPDNDFPTRVIYERAGEVLTARIEGEIDGRPQAMTWTFQSRPLNTRCPA